MQLCEGEYTMKLSTIFKRKLREGNVYVVPCMYTKLGWVGYQVYIQHSDRIQCVREQGGLWSKKRNCYYTNTVESSRPLQVILSIGYALGLKFHDISQNYLVLGK